MKLKSFRIKNYKSIIDSGECRLSDNDSITILAGQNESGKSSILQALRDFEDASLNLECIRDDDTFPEISCCFAVVKDDINVEDILEENDFPQSLRDIIPSITELNVTKTFNIKNECTITISEEITSILKHSLTEANVLISEKNLKITSGEITDEEKDSTYSVDETVEEIITEILRYTPSIIFFDDFCDLLPDQILLSDLKTSSEDVRGLQAVKNIQTILKTDFTLLDKVNDGKRETTQNGYHETITAVFNEKWKQRIGEENGAKIHIKYYQGKREGGSYLRFYIETKKGEYLSVGKRSQGFKWFLSFFLHLKAEDQRSNELIILFDEPGLYLHSKAQADMIAVFEELALNNQIIYSTHSPYLIDTSKLNRLRLVLNTSKYGTTIEKITSNKIKNQKDALKPIIDAIGLEIATPFSTVIKNNIILEGISDFYYVLSMKKILQKNYDLGLIPSMGSSNVHLLMELCMGWGLNWLIIFDDKGAQKDYNKIKKNFFNDSEDEVAKKIYKLKDCDGIEDAFTIGDMKLVNEEAKFSSDKKNSDVVMEYGGKELFARLFYEGVNKGNISKDKLSKTAIKKFEDIFIFIESAFNIKSK